MPYTYILCEKDRLFIFGPGSEKLCFWKENKLQQINFPADRGITVNCLQLSLAANPVDSALAFMGGEKLILPQE